MPAFMDGKPSDWRRSQLRIQRRTLAARRARTKRALRTVEGVHGVITDSSSLFTVDKGQTYKEFWTNVSTDWADAAFAVAGTVFDKDPTPESIRISGEPEAQILADKLHLGPRSRVLEIGAGVGRLAYHMCRYAGHYSGVDISPNMLAVARRELAGKTNWELRELVEAAPLPFADRSFDAVYSQAVFIHLDREDCYRYIREAFRVLRPGGRAYFQFYNLLHPAGFDIFHWVAENTVTAQGKVRGRVHFPVNVEVRAYVENAGFVMDEAASHLEPVDQHYPFPVPILNYDYYLIAVAEKPAAAGTPPAELTSRAARPRVTRFSDAYYRAYLDAFTEKVRRHAPDLASELIPFLAQLSLELAFQTVHEVERGVMALERRKEPPTLLLPLLRAAANEDYPETPLWARVRARVQRLAARG
jgi:SAM-dependent methyltransferase